MGLDRSEIFLGAFAVGILVGFGIPSKYDILHWIIRDLEDTLYYFLPIGYHFEVSVIAALLIVLIVILSFRPFIESLFSGLDTFGIALLLCIFGFIIGKIGKFVLFN